ncbi:MAG: hypothetical protein JXB07_02000 [Anaerolineae bacterium]|nr:hypothetical protein [Anaerolineae bacterium]
MIDWQVKAQELKQTADELDLWAAKSDGRQRTVLGRIADELRQFAAQIQHELMPPNQQEAGDVPDWLTAIVVSSSDNDMLGDQEDESIYYSVDEEQWLESGDEIE